MQLTSTTMSLSLFCAPYWQVESVPVQEGSGTGGSGGMVGHLHPCPGFPRPPGTPTILPTTYYRPQTLPTTTTDSKPLWKGFPMRTSAATLRSLPNQGNVGQWQVEEERLQGGASASKAAQRTPWGISKASSREFKLDACSWDFLYFQRLNLCSNTPHQGMMARNFMEKISA